MRRPRPSAIVFAAIAIGFVFLCLRYWYRVHNDTFSEKLADMAGDEAEYLGVYEGWSAELEVAMADAYRSNQAFWARSEREFRNIHGPERWTVSEGFVCLDTNRIYQIDRYPPTFWRSERLVFRRINAPHIRTRVDNTYYIAMHDKDRMTPEEVEQHLGHVRK
jgi:hypothetical protein